MKASTPHIEASVTPKKQESTPVKERTVEKPHRVSLTPENDPRQKPSKD
ncbi:MAG: hypothetical protein LPK48_07995 [Bacteroidota bacterium]|nr:hypothetical protein [Bacteroidota bacterium]